MQVLYESLPGPYGVWSGLGMVESPMHLSGSPGNYTFLPSTTNLTLSGLAPFTNYSITVFASTSAGGGLNSSHLVKTNETGESIHDTTTLSLLLCIDI